MFKAWDPVYIEPKSHENQEDLDVVLRHRLKLGGEGGLVEAEDLEEAVKMMRKKSQGQFVWCGHDREACCMCIYQE